MIASRGAARRGKFDRRAVLKALFGVPLSSLPATTSMRSADAQAALQPIRMGIQIFTGAVATVWFEKKIYEKRGLLVEARQFADGRSVRDAMVADQLNAGTMNITPFIVGAAVSSLTMVGVVSLGGDTVGVLARRGSGISSVADLRGRRIGISVGSTTGNIFIQMVAPQAGLKQGDYQVINMRPAAQIAALSAGSVDAVTSFEPAAPTKMRPQLRRIRTAEPAAPHSQPGPHRSHRLLRRRQRTPVKLAVRRQRKSRGLFAESSAGAFDIKDGTEVYPIRIEDAHRW
jgi:hypothetical protein